MLKKTIKYVDYNDVEREEDFYFNLTKSELTEMELSANGGLSTMIERLIKEKDASKMITIFKDIILKSYGEKSDDGKHFRKSEEISKSFSETEAYNELFMDIISTPDRAIEFLNGILPADVRDKMGNNPQLPVQ